MIDWELIVGDNIRRLRKAKGLTQDQLAVQAGMAARYMAGIERGEENPSLRFLVRLAEVLDFQPADLLRAPGRF